MPEGVSGNRKEWGRPVGRSRLLKKSASSVPASLRGSAYGPGKRVFTQTMDGQGEKGLRLASLLAAALLDSLFMYPEVIQVSAPNGNFWPYGHRAMFLPPARHFDFSRYRVPGFPS